MEDTSRQPNREKMVRWWRVAVIAVIGIGAIWELGFVLDAYVPKIVMSARDAKATLSPGFEAVGSSYFLLEWAVWTAGAVFAVLTLASLSWFVAMHWRHRAFFCLKLFVAFVLFLNLGLFTASAFQEWKVTLAHLRKEQVFADALDKFVLKQEAEKKFEQVQRAFERDEHMKLVEIKDISKLSRQERYRRKETIVRTLQEQNLPEIRKSLLASAVAFEEEFAWDRKGAAQILEAARGLGIEETKDLKTFFAWLRPRLHTDGWEPLPVFVFVYEP